MQLIKPDTHIDFIRKVRFAVIFSAILIIISAVSLITKGGPKYGIDFAGGTVIQVKFTKPVYTQQIRESINKLDAEGTTVQPFGDRDDYEYLINMSLSDTDLDELSNRLRTFLENDFGEGGFEIRRVEMVGPKVGAELRKKGMYAVVFSLLGMLIYIWWRFEFRFGIGAIVALAHDLIITIGALSLTGKSIDLPIIAALLTVVGYSVNDTIIVSDRIRETRKKVLRKDLKEVINISINKTLSRTLITSGTTLFVVLALFLFGGGIIHDFAFTMLVGIFIGTYSSIFISSPTLLLWDRLVAGSKKRG